MKKVRIAIVEDEMINAETLHDMLEDLGYEVFGKYMRAEKAWEAFQTEQPDFALLDIRLKGEKTGIWLAQQIKENYQLPYIFLTSFGDQQTIESAAKTDAFGYLMKPVEKQNLHAAIEVALHKFSSVNQVTQEENEKAADETSGEVVIRDSLFVKDEHYYSKILLDDILYIKSDDNYLELYTAEKKHLIRGTLKTFGSKLPKEKFRQAHRSYLVNLSKIEGVGANFVKIKGESIPMSKAYKEDLMKQFNIY